MAAAQACACNCKPCVCAPPAGEGCIPLACVPRPCFFGGQLIGSEDLNQVVAYARNQQQILSRFLGGWGIYGGLRVDVPDSPNRRVLATGQLRNVSNNPQIIASTNVLVSPGIAVDALGRTLVACETQSIDLQALAQRAAQGTIRTASCSELLGSRCGDEPITVSEFFLMAEFVETPTRPAAQFSGGGACDPAPTCDFSRKQESIKFSLVGCLPDIYQYTGCIDETGYTLPDMTLGLEPDGRLCRDEVFAFIDRVQSDLAASCCTRPAVALAKVSFTRDPGSLRGELPAAPLYTILDNGYPCRRPVFQAGLFTKFFPNSICSGL